MTINVGGTFFLRLGSLCRKAALAGLVGVLLPASGCTSTSTNNVAPTALT